MKYMMLAYTSADAWSSVDVTSAEFQAMCAFYEELQAELTESGELVETRGLADPRESLVVRKVDGVPTAVDGPFAEAKEVLVSYSVVECAGRERAVEIASRVVAAVGDTVEIRPVAEGPPET